jgi:GNAT superfamily N-acetyltransferase
MAISYLWRGDVANAELNALHAEAFDTRVYDDDEWDWVTQLRDHSLGWVLARDGDALVGFVNVLWDGLVHAWIQDTMVATAARHRGIATELVARATAESRAAGCEWLHVDFEPHLTRFYLEECGFRSTPAGVIALQSG